MKRLLAATMVLLACAWQMAAAQNEQSIWVGFSFEDSHNLIEHLRAQGYNAELDDECCQPEEDAVAIWIGRKVPVEDVKYIVTQAIQAYPRLVYYEHLGDEHKGYPKHLDYAIYIGGSKSVAACETRQVPAETALELFSMIYKREHLEFMLESLRIKNLGETSGCA